MTTKTIVNNGVQDDHKTEAGSAVATVEAVREAEPNVASVFARIKSQRAGADRHINSLPLRKRIAALRKEGKL